MFSRSKRKKKISPGAKRIIKLFLDGIGTKRGQVSKVAQKDPLRTNTHLIKVWLSALADASN